MVEDKRSPKLNTKSDDLGDNSPTKNSPLRISSSHLAELWSV